MKDRKNESAIQTALKLVAYRFKNDQRENQESVLENAAIQNLIWELLETNANLWRIKSYDWE
ncbi:MAG: hypothetical protein AB4426_18755 [Xenococcaceae cyanobacterium]